ncbi:MAG: response regulator transcription factor [Bacteroidia bacterium]
MKTVLLIENNPDILENLVEAFELKGYNVITAHNGYQGIKLAEELIPNLIISGIIIGKTDGYEVLRTLKGREKTSEIPFIFSTTKAEKSDKAVALGLGANDYIIKPYGLEPLFKMAKMWTKNGITKQMSLSHN